MTERFDCIVIGGGHAGTEAALAAARMGARTLLITQAIDTIGQMSCNPAIGGIGKGHLVREVDALGGLMGRAADAAGIQFRTLNESKGPAVRATRGQMDRSRYKAFVRAALESQPGLALFQQQVTDLVVEGDAVAGVETAVGARFLSPAVVLTAGTFLAGLLHVGETRTAGGRAGDPGANALAARLRERGFPMGRLKTGTPPRLDGRTIDFSRLTRQEGQCPPPCFSYLGPPAERSAQVPCHITHTNEATHEIIRAALHRSPLYSGQIEGVGPRYCPSVEDKVVRFAERLSHQIFVEPEGLDTAEIYPNGISTSLPFDVQLAFVRSIRGFEQARITRPGYAIEYDYFDPRVLRHTLEIRLLTGLFCAGQVNGTTGYEEAAAQGLLAGVNAARHARGESAWCPRRDEAYLGVMVDDLVTRGVTEPYRMFTSRAEYRLRLREDNADLRLTPAGRALGLVDDVRWAAFLTKEAAISAEQERLAGIWLTPAGLPAEEQLSLLGQPLRGAQSLLDLLLRPEVSYASLRALAGFGEGVADEAVAFQVEVQAKYEGYIQRQDGEIARALRYEETALPADLEYAAVRGLSTEVLQKLTAHRPATLGQAARISGVTPAAISLLLVHLRRHGLSFARGSR
jgi:tRNA uridine 5-carboxymethylaminomethyl modification enzyme